MSPLLKYISAYPAELQHRVQQMIDRDQLTTFLRSRYPGSHHIANDNELRAYVMALKERYLKKSGPLSKIVYDSKLHVINNALGLHRQISRIQGGKLKSKNEIRISAVFKKAPEAFLNMIAVHELAHLKQSNHNKEFYQLCLHMLPDYYQLEFDLRLYLIQRQLDGAVYR